MIIDAATPDATSAYKLMIGSVLPRAIGRVSTQSTDGVNEPGSDLQLLDALPRSSHR